MRREVAEREGLLEFQTGVELAEIEDKQKESMSDEEAYKQYRAAHRHEHARV